VIKDHEQVVVIGLNWVVTSNQLLFAASLATTVPRMPLKLPVSFQSFQRVEQILGADLGRHELREQGAGLGSVFPH